LAKFVDTTCISRGAGAAVGHGGAVKELKAMETCKKTKKIVSNYVCFSSLTMLTSKIITEISL